MPIKKCSACLYGKAIPLSTDVLCRYCGVVTHDYGCGSFRSTPYPQKQAAPRKCINCASFVPDSLSDHNAVSGTCKLFTVRSFDGQAKKACSKFISIYAK